MLAFAAAFAVKGILKVSGLSLSTTTSRPPWIPPWQAPTAFQPQLLAAVSTVEDLNMVNAMSLSPLCTWEKSFQRCGLNNFFTEAFAWHFQAIWATRLSWVYQVNLSSALYDDSRSPKNVDQLTDLIFSLHKCPKHLAAWHDTCEWCPMCQTVCYTYCTSFWTVSLINLF